MEFGRSSSKSCPLPRIACGLALTTNAKPQAESLTSRQINLAVTRSASPKARHNISDNDTSSNTPRHGECRLIDIALHAQGDPAARTGFEADGQMGSVKCLRF